MSVTINKATLQVPSVPALSSLVVGKATLQVASRSFTCEDLLEAKQPGVIVSGTATDAWIDDYQDGDAVIGDIPARTPVAFVGSGVLSGTGVYNFSSLLDAAGGVPTLQQGDCVVVVYEVAYTGTGPALAGPAGYLSATPEVKTTLGQKIFYKFMDTVPDTSVTINTSLGTNWYVNTIHVLRNVDPTNPVDDWSFSQPSGPASKIRSPSLTAMFDGSLALFSGGHRDNQTVVTAAAELSSTTNHFRNANTVATLDPSIGTGIILNVAGDATVQTTDFGGPTTNDWIGMGVMFRPKLA